MSYAINEQNIKTTDFDGLLAVILGNPETAYHVSNFISNSNNIPTLDQLQKIHGVGRRNALKVLACMELSSKYIIGTKSQTYRFPEDIAARVSFLKFEVQEHLCLITMDSANHIINIHELTTGLVNQTLVHPREAFRHAIADNATSVIFAHNHPSGSTEESPEDLSITRILVAAGKIIQIPVIDHIIISKSGFNSLLRKFPEMFDTKQKGIVQ